MLKFFLNTQKKQKDTCDRKHLQEDRKKKGGKLHAQGRTLLLKV